MLNNLPYSIDFILNIVPIAVIAVTAMIVLMSNNTQLGNSPWFHFSATLTGLTTGLVSHQLWSASPTNVANSSFVHDPLGSLSSNLLLIVAIIFVGLIFETGRQSSFFRPDISATFLLSICGLMSMVSSANLATIYIGLELASIGFYTLTGYINRTRFGIEAAMKYMVMGAYASGFLVFGMALMYLSSGSLDLEAQLIVGGESAAVLWRVGFLMVTVALLFKVALVPFHSWAPDAYEAAPTPFVGFMAIAMKLAAFTTLVRLAASQPAQPVWAELLAITGIASMFCGNILALVQTSLKRMLAYSSIAHSGYLAVALSLLTSQPSLIETLYFYLAGYAAATICAFGVLSWLESATHENLQLRDLAELHIRFPKASICLSIAMISLAGLPPCAGFMAKFFLLHQLAVYEAYGLLVAVALASAVSLYYYLRVIIRLYFTTRLPVAAPIAPSRAPVTTLVMTACCIGILAVGTVAAQHGYDIVKSRFKLATTLGHEDVKKAK